MYARRIVARVLTSVARSIPSRSCNVSPYLSTVALFRYCAIDRRSASMSFSRDPAPRHLRTRHRKMYTRRLRFLPRGETASSSFSNPLEVRSISRCNEHTQSTRVFLRLFGFAGLKEFQFVVILWRMHSYAILGFNFSEFYAVAVCSWKCSCLTCIL